jgi:mannose-6-phosphate isomerase-like protein (cupin superfamily)
VPVDRSSVPVVAWAEGCLAWRLVDSDGLSVKHERLAAGASERPHRHRRARQFFFVLDGMAEIRIGHRTHALETRQGLEVAPGQRHVLSAVDEWPLEVLVISAPSTEGDRIEDGAR